MKRCPRCRKWNEDNAEGCKRCEYEFELEENIEKG